MVRHDRVPGRARLVHPHGPGQRHDLLLRRVRPARRCAESEFLGGTFRHRAAVRFHDGQHTVGLLHGRRVPRRPVSTPAPTSAPTTTISTRWICAPAERLPSLPQWLPFIFNGPAQDRSPVVATTVISGATSVVFLGSQDGYVYAADAATGAGLWQSRRLGDAVQAAPAGIFSVFGSTVGDRLFVGTRNVSSENSFFSLDVRTGRTDQEFTNGRGSNGIGIINGTATVDYATSRVYFTSCRPPAEARQRVVPRHAASRRAPASRWPGATSTPPPPARNGISRERHSGRCTRSTPYPAPERSTELGPSMGRRRLRGSVLGPVLLLH